MNYLDIVNKVLEKLREATVASTGESEYSTLVSGFVLATKREMESAWNWTTLRTTITVPTVQATTSYSITGAGKRYTILDVFDTTNERFLQRMTSALGRRDITLADQGVPHRYFLEGQDSSGDPKIWFSLVPDGVYSIDVNLVVPQTDTPSDATEIVMDEWPVILGAYAKAISERGEDSGRTSGEALNSYKLAIGDAIALDVNNTHGEDEWYV